MAFPAGASTITVTGTLPVPVGGTPRTGQIIFTPTAVLVDSTQHAIYSGGSPVTLDNAGHFSAVLLCNDDPDIQPTGWRWLVDEHPAGGRRRAYYIDLPSTLGPTVDLSTLAEVSAPDGTSGSQTATPTGPAGGALTGAYPNPTLSSATIASFDTAGAAATAQTAAAADATTKASAAQAAATSAAATDATTKVGTHTAATDPHADRAYADSKFATQLNLTALSGTVNNLATTVTTLDGYFVDALTRIQAIEQGTAFLAGGHYTEPVELANSAQPVSNPAAGVYVFSEGGVLKTLSPSGDVVSLLPAGGLQERTARVRIIDDNLSGLPAAASWAVVETSTGTKLQCSIAAVAGDRIRVCGNCMYLGAHLLDWVLLDSAGVIAEYATSESSTPPAEGSPTMYPSRTYGTLNNPELFTVGSGHISAGLVTVALAHQGAGTGGGNVVYAHPTYPFRLRLENIGPEPA
ncbi:hypothetical protein [Streptomyces sp. AK08-02]|uniref:hypothetical protein n=1 Tax=Streptomyces sp. AK08-02 TaxID=3028654 RepID=UPI0029A614E9|nr:hypothetical protein [Streptomyces sp. AK08-02]MDX3747467.1 hypothetical protein [Streptomyces sp. AK08-02]